MEPAWWHQCDIYFLKETNLSADHVSIINPLFVITDLLSFVCLQCKSQSPPPSVSPPPPPPSPSLLLTFPRCCCCCLRVFGAVHRSHGGLSQRDEEDLLGAGDQTAGPVRLQSSQDLRQRSVAAVEILRLCRYPPASTHS